MRKDLRSYSNLALSSELIDRWVQLSESGRFDRAVALKTAKLNKEHLERLSKFNSVEEVLATLEYQVVVSSAMHYLGEKYALGQMGLLINSVFDFVKVGKAIESFVMPEMCRMIIEEFGLWLTFADLKLCLKKGITGRYGTTFDRLDTQVIFQWLRLYRTERFEISEQIRKEALRKQRAEDKGVPMPEELKEKFEAIEKRLNERPGTIIESNYEPVLSRNLDHLRNHDQVK